MVLISLVAQTLHAANVDEADAATTDEADAANTDEVASVIVDAIPAATTDATTSVSETLDPVLLHRYIFFFLA